MPTLAGSSGIATRPSGGRSIWEQLAYTELGDGTLRIHTWDRTSGDDNPCCGDWQSFGNADLRPPLSLDAILCERSHEATARAIIDLGPEAVFTDETTLRMWGWNVRCELECTFSSGRVERFGPWDSNEHDVAPSSSNGVFQIPACAGAHKMTLAGGGYCGQCHFPDGPRAKWMAPPSPPGEVSPSPPPWPPAPEANGTFAPHVHRVVIGVAIFLFLVLPCCKSYAHPLSARQLSLYSPHRLRLHCCRPCSGSSRRTRRRLDRRPPRRPAAPAARAAPVQGDAPQEMEVMAEAVEAVPAGSDPVEGLATLASVAVAVPANAAVPVGSSLVVPGVAVGPPRVAVAAVAGVAVPTAVASTAARPAGMTLAQKAELVRAELGLSRALTGPAEIAAAAIKELGLREERLLGESTAARIEALLVDMGLSEGV